MPSKPTTVTEYLATLPPDRRKALQAIRKDFKYMGDSGTYHFLWTVGEEVPPYEEWCATHERKRR